VNLVAHELTINSGIAALKQLLTIGDEDVYLGGIRPHILKVGAPAGSLYLEVRTAADVLIQASETVTIASITAATGTYFHGYVRFAIPITLLKNTSYYVVMQSTGYTFAESAYIAWCNDFDLRKYSTEYTANAATAALDMEMWEYKLITRGSYP
jgi:hypothetical protein